MQGLMLFGIGILLAAAGILDYTRQNSKTEKKKNAPVDDPAPAADPAPAE